MQPMWSHILAPLIEAAIGPKYGKIIWNDALEELFKELNCMVFTETLLSYPYWKIIFTVHIDSSDKSWVPLLVRIINLSHFTSGLRNPKCDYNMTNNELLLIVECIK